MSRKPSYEELEQRVEALERESSERKKAEDALRKNEEELEAIFHAVGEGIAIFDMTGKVTKINKRILEVGGYSEKDILGKRLTFLKMFPRQSIGKMVRNFTKLISGERTSRFEVEVYTKTGKKLDVELQGSPLRNKEYIIGMVGVMREITERKRAEEELQKSKEQLRNLADNLQSLREEERTTMAHEIHDETEQALIGLNMDLSWLAGKVPGDREELLQKIRAMSGLVSDTHKTVQRITTELRPGLLDDLGLAAAMEWQTEKFQSRTGIPCTLTVDPEDIVMDDRRSTALFRILQESLTNASSHAGATRVTVSLKEKDGHIALRVRDNGKGITEEQISRNTSFGIMGIRERVHPWEGEVKISGSPGKGTTVEVILDGGVAAGENVPGRLLRRDEKV